MSITETLNDGSQRSYEIRFSSFDLDAKVNAKVLRAQLSSPGSVAGIQEQQGQQFWQEAIQESVNDTLKAHFEETGHKPAMPPELRMKSGGNPGQNLVLEVSYELLPKMPEVDIASLELERFVVVVTEDDLKEALEGIAEAAPAFADRAAGAAAQDGDQVVIDFIGRVDGEAFEGGSADGYPLVLGSNSFIPGFEAQLVGAKAGDKVDVSVTFPGDYNAPSLAGKDAIFECTVHTVQGPESSKVDDSLAQGLGLESLEQLREMIAARMQKECTAQIRDLMKTALLEAAGDFEVSETLIESEAGQVAHQQWHMENPHVHGHDHPNIETTDEHRAIAERQVRLTLLLGDIGRANKIQVTDEEMTKAIMEQAATFPGREREFLDFVQQNPQVQQQLHVPVFEDKVVDYVFANAKVSKSEISVKVLQEKLE